MKTKKEQFEKDGYIVLKNKISRGLLKELKGNINSIFLPHMKKGEDVPMTAARLGEKNKELLYLLDQVVQKLSVWSKFTSLFDKYVDELMPKGYHVNLGNGVLFGLPNDKRLAYDWHQEISYMFTTPSTLSFWFPVYESAIKKNGTMSVLKGSHKLGKLPYVKSRYSSNSYTDLIPKNIKNIEKQFEEVFCDTEPTDLVILNHYIIHRSNPNSTNKTRISGSLRLSSIQKTPEKVKFSPDDY